MMSGKKGIPILSTAHRDPGFASQWRQNSVYSVFSDVFRLADSYSSHQTRHNVLLGNPSKPRLVATIGKGNEDRAMSWISTAPTK